MRLCGKGQSGLMGLTKDLAFIVTISRKGAGMKDSANILCLLLCLSACGGGAGGGDGAVTDPVREFVDPRLLRLDVYEAQKLRVLGNPGIGVIGMAATPDENMPVAGAVAYAGFASMRVETGTQPMILFGDANLEVNFDSSVAQGRVTNVFGGRQGAGVANYAGTLALQSTTVGHDMPLSYAGDLSAGAQTLGFAGVMTGVFLGDDASAFAGGDLEAQVDVGGTPTEGTVVVTLEQVGAP